MRRRPARAAAIPILDQLEANDDGIQARSLLAGHAIAEGRFDEAERLIAEIERLTHERTGFGGAFVTGTVRAELALAQGDIEEGLRLYRVAGKELAAITLPGMELTGLEPWSLFGEAAGATAYALHGTGQEGADLFEALRAKAPQVLERGPSPDGLPGRRHGAARARHLGAAEAGDRPRGRHPAAGAGRAVRVPAVHDHHGPRARPRTRPSGSRPAWPPGSGRSTASARARTSCRRPGPSPSGSLLSCWLHLAAVGPHRERREDRHDDRAAEQRPADLRR